MPEPRWDLAITHRADDCVEFVKEYFDQDERKILLIAGAGFDPRATLLAETLGALTKPSIHAALVKEVRRGSSDNELHDLANKNMARFAAALPDHEVLTIDIFSADSSVTGGRAAALAVSQLDLSGVTDIVVDVSALSIGVSFPIIRWVLCYPSRADRSLNVHIFVSHEPDLDARIVASPADTAVPVHGFDGRLRVSSENQKIARLWLPQLAKGRASALSTIYGKTQADEVCVVLPFPAGHPRSGDTLLEELLSTTSGIPWDFDPRSIVYADESDPLDLYRTTMRLQMLREPVFEESGGSSLILSPIGSKVMALGALLAAHERNLPVLYVEDFSYSLIDPAKPEAETSEPTLMHVWLEGSPYPYDRAEPIWPEADPSV